MTTIDSTKKDNHLNEATILASALSNTSIHDDKQHEALVDNMLDTLIDSDTHNKEYHHTTLKDILLNPTEQNVNYLTQLLSGRIEQGRGETLFEIGTDEDGSSMHLTKEDYATCIKTITQVTEKLDADFANIDDLDELDPTKVKTNKNENVVAHLMIRKRPKSVQDLLEIRVAVVGNVDAGKSTMLGVLTKGVLDDGRGKARVNLFRHKHEIESGRTSSVGGEILGFDSKSRPIMQHTSHTAKRASSWEDIAAKAAKVLSFVDLAGHEKYLKTTVFGMTGSAPEFTMLMVGANAGMIGMSKEHLGLALSLNIPVLVVITKIDRCPQHVLDKTIKELASILKSKSCRKIPLFVENNHDVVMTA
ncbi:hypothetical protein CU098_003127, partial [Rhizopus stolonifer]